MATASQHTVAFAHEAHAGSSHFYLLPGLIGFGLTSQTALTILFFKSDPQQATLAILVFSLVSLALAILSSVGGCLSIPSSCFKTPLILWCAAFVGLALLSIVWSQGPLLAAAGYWATWAANIATVLVVLTREEPLQQANSLIKGAVWGALLVATVAWSLPSGADLRLGDEDFLHPNVIGRLFAYTILLAMYLARENKLWRWLALALAITLLRTLSKTSILAFVAAILFYLIYDSVLSRAAKIRIGLLSTVVLLSFWGFLEAYLETYTQSNSLETLTGRTLIWTQSANFALEKPWLGYGFYSYRSVVPPFGTFAAWHAHNELLQQFFSFGIPGAVVVIGLYWAFFRQIRQSAASHLKTLASALLVFALARGLTDTEPYDLSLPLWLMAMLSILLCSTQTATPSPSLHASTPLQ